MTMRLLKRTGDLISDSSFQPVHSPAVTEPGLKIECSYAEIVPLKLNNVQSKRKKCAVK